MSPKVGHEANAGLRGAQWFDVPLPTAAGGDTTYAYPTTGMGAYGGVGTAGTTTASDADVGACFLGTCMADQTQIALTGTTPVIAVYLVDATTVNHPFTGASWVEGTLSLTKTGAFANYTHVAGDTVTIASGTNTTPGTYKIASKTSADTIVLATSLQSAPSASNIAGEIPPTPNIIDTVTINRGTAGVTGVLGSYIATVAGGLYIPKRWGVRVTTTGSGLTATGTIRFFYA